MSILGMLPGGGDKSRDDVRRQNEALGGECKALQEEHKRLKTLLDQLRHDYEQSKDFEIIRRYSLLKGMIKRCLLQQQIAQNSSQNDMIGSEVKEKEEARRREERLSNMTRQEVMQENSSLQDDIKELRRKVVLLSDALEQLRRNYEASKRYLAARRYSQMKVMVKTTISNKWF